LINDATQFISLNNRFPRHPSYLIQVSRKWPDDTANFLSWEYRKACEHQRILKRTQEIPSRFNQSQALPRSMEFLRSLVRRRFARAHQVATSRDVGCFLRPSTILLDTSPTQGQIVSAKAIQSSGFVRGKLQQIICLPNVLRDSKTSALKISITNSKQENL